MSKLFIMLSMLAILAGGCDAPKSTTLPVDPGRIVAAFYGVTDSADQVVEGAAPGPQYLRIMIHVQPAKKDRGLLSEVLRKVEIDFGAGEGWADVTARRLYAWSDLDYSTWESYTYSAPGTYVIRSRTTFHDGEVLETTYPTITVLDQPGNQL
jgi:hypothetical protein